MKIMHGNCGLFSQQIFAAVSTTQAVVKIKPEPMNFGIPLQCSTNRANGIFIYSLHGFITNRHYDKLPIHINDFHVFTVIYSSLHGFIMRLR